MGKKLPYTPRSRVKAALRNLWLRSRERAAALKREKYCCEKCHKKQSKAKGKEFSLEVHHIKGNLNWENVINSVYMYLLCDPSELQVLCKKCHEKIHKGKECQ